MSLPVKVRSLTEVNSLRGVTSTTLRGVGSLVSPVTGRLLLSGYAPVVAYVRAPTAGRLSVRGYAPNVELGTVVRASVGGLSLRGYTPLLAASVVPSAGRLSVRGYTPAVARFFSSLLQQSKGPLQAGATVDSSINSLRLGMAQSAIQRSWAGGELAPALYARTDQTKYQTGLRTCRNFIVQRHGGAANRPGTQFVCEVKDSADDVRIIDFVFNDQQTYLLELGDQYLRVIRNGARISVTPLGDWNGGTTYALGDVVTDSGGTQKTWISLQDGNVGHNPSLPAGWWHEITNNIFEMPTPWASADLTQLNYVQKDDVIIVVHRSYPVYEIRRYDHDVWLVTPFTFGPSNLGPTALTTSGGAAGASSLYKVTAVEKETYEESYTGMEAVKTLTNLAIVSGTTWRGTVASTAGWATGDSVFFGTVVGPDEFTNREFVITALTGTTFDVTNPDTAGGAFTSGTVYLAYGKRNAFTPTAGSPITVSWTASDPSNTLEYNVYRAVNGVFGYIGTARGTSFVDSGITPDTSATPPDRRELFMRAGEYPGAVGYYQQRLLFGNSDVDPQAIWASKSSNPRNFSTSLPSQSDDAVTWRQRGTKNNEVRYMAEIGGLIVFTSTSQWLIQGGTDGVLRPGEINPKSQGSNGCAEIAPVVVSDSAIFVQARGAFVRDLKYELTNDGYTGKDLSVFADHLFSGYTMRRMAYAEIPNSVVWVVRTDGTLLGLTYMREHDVWGWHRHDTDGDFLDVRSIPEGTEDAVYVLVQREVNGATKKFIERFASRQFTDVVRDAIFLDSSLTYDGENVAPLGSDNTPGCTMLITTDTTWNPGELLTITSGRTAYYGGSLYAFGPGDVGDAIVLLYEQGGVARRTKITITQYVSATQVKGYADTVVPAEYQSIPTSSWARAVRTVYGLGHLDGAQVTVLADGVVLNAVVAAGTITLVSPAAFIHAGLGYTSELETLDIDTVQGETLRDKEKLVTSVAVLVQSSGNVRIGPDVAHLRSAEAALIPSAPGVVTGVLDVSIDSNWNTNGRFLIRQDDPLPLTVLAAIPRGIVAMEGGN